jgi:NAD+ diphosphatase
MQKWPDMQKPIDLRPAPQLGYIDSPLTHAAHRRDDAAFLAQSLSGPDSGFYLLGGESVLLKMEGEVADPLFAPQEAARFSAMADPIFLGLHGAAARFAVHAAPDFVDGQGVQAVDLRSIAAQKLVAAEHLAPLAEAKALLHWHARHGFCAGCGAPTKMVQGGWRRDCPRCNYQHFPRTDPVVIMLAVHDDVCLLGRQSRFPPNMWSCLAGFVEPGETLEEAARRETMEEAGIACGRVRYFASQPWPFPASIMIGCHMQATSQDITVDRSELEDARWFGRDEVAAMLGRTHPDRLITPAPFAIAHHIIRAWVERGEAVFA